MWSWIRGENRSTLASSTGVAVAAKLGECGVEVAGVPQHDGVEDETESSELVFLAFAVALAQLSALTLTRERRGQLHRQHR